MTRRIDLNADLGESFGAWIMGDDDALLEIVTSANVACGFHAGDPAVMRRTAAAAKARGVAVGAHPAFPDLQGFGRRRLDMAPADLRAAIVYQIGALAALAAAEGARLAHVKPHGALSNMACADRTLAETVVAAVRDVDRDLILLAPALSELAAAGDRAGLAVAREIFADRTCEDDGRLTPRDRPGAVIHDPAESLAHTLAMLDAGALVTRTGARLPTPIDSVCVHGDGPAAVATARTLAAGLAAAGWTLAAFAR